MKKVFVSGCYDIIHAGHVRFFRDARKLGDHLTVCYASDKVLMLAKNRKPSIPEDNKSVIIGAIKHVDEVVKSSDLHSVLDFESHLRRGGFDLLVVTDDDRNAAVKEALCQELGVRFVVLPKASDVTRTSTTNILRNINGRINMPLRVDFAGGWLDVPRFSVKGGYIVNCTISPLVSLEKWPYEKGSGLGGSAAYALLQIKNGVQSEIKMGVGWQDPAIVSETGLCVWRSGKRPVLEAKYNPDWLEGRMLILWTGSSHNAPEITKMKRDFKLIKNAGIVAKEGADKRDVKILAKAVSMSYEVQIGEGMKPLPKIAGALSMKYLGAGHGGYALYLFSTKSARDKALKHVANTKKIEPYCRPVAIS